ncbi:hypothetical protein HID58_063875 [Brassica napus]|uniref:ATPase AAA-type core domain-containing protein n=1 Tax=Brassica napus TaxID=3708 RepID=A0ABQ7Z8D1_BRANA|nr:hypothetical protein HID58_063875 [Brassica napus]
MQICCRVIFSASPDPPPPRDGVLSSSHPPEPHSAQCSILFNPSLPAAPELRIATGLALVGLSTQSLKRLSINAGSLVVINNIDIGIQRIAQVVVLDPPPKTTTLDDASLVLDSLHTMLVFPTYDLMMMTQQLLAQEVQTFVFSVVKGYAPEARTLYISSLLNYRSCAQVIAMEPSNERFLRVNHYQTALVLGGTVSSGLPPDLLVSRSKVPMPLQEDAVNVLASVLSPPLCPSALSSKLRVAVLLHGLPGCGKRTVVNYVARRLGLHVVEYSCHSLLASSERKTSTALAQTFNMARSLIQLGEGLCIHCHRFRPTILLLRHFDVFKNLGSQDGSQGDRVGVASEIASVIRELTEPVSNGEYSSMEEESNDNSVSFVPLLSIACCTSVDEVGKFRGHQVRCFSHEIRMSSLNDEQRSEMLSQSLQGVSQLLNAAKRKVLNSDSEESLPEDDPDSVVVEYVDFIKAMDQLSPSLSHK